MGLLQILAEKRALNKLNSDPNFLTFCQVLGEMINSDEAISKCPKETKQKIAEQNIQEAQKILLSDSPFLTCRQWLAKCVLLRSKTLLLFLTKKEKLEGVYPSYGISGELSKYQKDILKKFFPDEAYEHGEDALEVIKVDNTLQNFDMSMANILRIQLGDCHKNVNKDWFRPFFRFMVVWQEYQIREELGLPQIVDVLEALNYSTCMDLVLRGEQRPHLKVLKNAKNFKKTV